MTTQLLENRGGVCGWTPESARLPLLSSAQHLPVAAVPWDSVLGPASLTQVLVGLLRLSRTHGSVSPVCPSLPVLTSLCPSFLGWEGEGQGKFSEALHLGAQCTLLQP